MLDFIRGRIAAKIQRGDDLQLNELQVILSCLHGVTECDVLIRLFHGHEIEYDIEKNVKAYAAKLSSERPPGDTISGRNVLIAIDFGVLRLKCSSEDALTELEKKSHKRYGIPLGKETIRSCITKGRKLLKVARSDYNELIDTFDAHFPERPCKLSFSDYLIQYLDVRFPQNASQSLDELLSLLNLP